MNLVNITFRRFRPLDRHSEGFTLCVSVSLPKAKFLSTLDARSTSLAYFCLWFISGSWCVFLAAFVLLVSAVMSLCVVLAQSQLCGFLSGNPHIWSMCCLDPGWSRSRISSALIGSTTNFLLVQQRQTNTDGSYGLCVSTLCA